MEKALKAIKQGFIYIDGVKREIIPNFAVQIDSKGETKYIFKFINSVPILKHIEVSENGFEVEPKIEEFGTLQILKEFYKLGNFEKFALLRKILFERFGRDTTNQLIAHELGYNQIKNDVWVKEARIPWECE